MLVHAKLYESEIQEKYLRTIDDPKYMYYHLNDSSDLIQFKDSDWSKLAYASVDSEGEVVGYFACYITRQARNVTDLSAVAFKECNTFAIDLMHFFDLLFLQRNFRKINFDVVVGNPAEKMYDKFIEEYGGRVVGIKEDETVLRDGNYYDLKLYEIKREQYILHRKDKRSTS